MIIAHFEIQNWEKDFLKTHLPNDEHLFWNEILFENLESEPKLKENLAKIEVLSVFIYDKVTSEVIAKMPNLKLIVTRSTGFDHIDLNAAKARNIPVCNVPSYGENTIAEHAFALILGIARRLPEIAHRTGECCFDYSDLRGFDLAGKTIGIIGAGKIGLHAIKIAKGFGLKILVYDVFQNPFLQEVLGFEYSDLDTLLNKSDIISLHAPYMPATHHLLNQAAFAKMKKGVVIINTARGALIDTTALVESLDSGIVKAAGLDVVEGEEDLLNCRQNLFLENLVKRENVIFTPHSGYFTKEAQERILQTSIKNINDFKIQKIQNQVK